MKYINNNFIKSTLLLSLTSISLYGAPSGVYLDAAGGVGFGDVQSTPKVQYVYKQGYIATVALGYQANLFRFELEERYKSDKLYSASEDGKYSIGVNGDLVSNSQLVNVYYSGYNTTSSVFSTVGVGVGITSLSLQDKITESGILSGQAMLSLGYPITENFISSLKYTYFYSLKSDQFSGQGDGSVTFTLRYIFD